MAKLSLYKVGSNGRVALGALATEGDFYTASIDLDGVITLAPVEVNTTTTKRTTGEQDQLPEV